LLVPPPPTVTITHSSHTKSEKSIDTTAANDKKEETHEHRLVAHPHKTRGIEILVNSYTERTLSTFILIYHIESNSP
jgi:hypothetical protein